MEYVFFAIVMVVSLYNLIVGGNVWTYITNGVASGGLALVYLNSYPWLSLAWAVLTVVNFIVVGVMVYTGELDLRKSRS